MIVLFTDFGLEDPYVGQLHAVLVQQAPQVPVIDLFHGVPKFDIRAGAYLLPAYASAFPENSVFLCVVDPGVGTTRAGVILQADGQWYVGPDNGLFHILARRARARQTHVITWRPLHLSMSFHGRDLFAPVAAMLARGERPPCQPAELTLPSGSQWPDDLAQVLYIDHYGNAVTGLRAVTLGTDRILKVGKHKLRYQRVFADAPEGEGFWYENANGLAEVAVNQARADKVLQLRLGDGITIGRTT
jgi:S-adenosylmethionine hydrolase